MKANADALVKSYVDDRAWAEKNHPEAVDAYTYAYHHDGPSMDYGGLGISQRTVLPLMEKFKGLI